ncbi:MAG: impB/mucB/samB family protein [Hyphomicrobiales bacterium]|nr:DNA-directed DNA polymerase [Rickettsiales bacterium]MCP5361132.1 impB/mucB/samB family protein [Hyphomicrobiales bacterium]
MPFPIPSLNWLYLDLNSYFASVEQQLNPDLRGKPVAVVPVETDATCAIAASYEAKAYGVRTGTMIYEAKKRCPALICVPAQHHIYLDYHHRILEIIDHHLPIEQVLSIDEVACRLIGNEQDETHARDLARAIKRSLYQEAGEAIRCSIGLAENRYLAKVATDLQKPDGLVVLYNHALPQALYPLALRDLPGIGRNMERRLRRAGIHSIRQLWQLSPEAMHTLWGSMGGEQFWSWLHGETPEEKTTTRRTVGHSHVLAPEWQPAPAARQVARRLLMKAASRLRRIACTASVLDLSLRTENGPRVVASVRFAPACDTLTLLRQMLTLWEALVTARDVSRIRKIAITLHGLQSQQHAFQPDLFSGDSAHFISLQKQEQLSQAMDQLNAKFGQDTVVIGSTPKHTLGFSGTKIAFTRIPEWQEFYE